MTLLWTFSVAFSNYQLFKDSLFSHKIVSYPRSSPSTYPNKPVCVITGATSGLGLSTACKLSKEGYVVVIGLMIGTNYIGPFVMTKLLLPLLESSHVSSKIVNVTSFTHRAVTNMQVDEGTVYGKKFLKSKQYPYAQIYEYSKLCLLLFSYELHRQLCQMGKSHQIFVNVANPRVVQTNIMREVPASLSWVAFFVLKRLRLLESSECGNDSIIDAALVPPGTSGAYFFWGKGRTINSSALSQDAKLAHELWETTSNLLSVTPFGN
ncbi:putative very-long-chain 3-oxoacyl-CoA reductase [Medicago truncatula]|uniref:Putative very-long-chain 3-oxoacyl-CoA reductase n=1 Tax=Medicago truncatula TaxID=3880 RepID=A0A396IYU2_MEDTR|nr:putative very-long-chain 3-oxoacyl-CoA reductase [Medicago truncatula]